MKIRESILNCHSALHKISVESLLRRLSLFFVLYCKSFGVYLLHLKAFSTKGDYVITLCSAVGKNY